jgi:hypothetical protein
MWNSPDQETLRRIPKLYATEHIAPQEKIIHLHLFIGSCDWFIAETDGEDLMFGFVILNGDYRNAEWGYISLAELKAISIHGIEIDNDIYWTPCPAGEVRTICRAHGWPLQQPNKQAANMTA